MKTYNWDLLKCPSYRGVCLIESFKIVNPDKDVQSGTTKVSVLERWPSVLPFLFLGN